ncbi:MAG TPA: SDR family oxidoreductase [Bryobacteraceae bacterium]|nr:SDR family oxidoreductase [Bryobacteraceae bacterium]
MKVLVIGGTQFIGRRLVTELLKAGHSVSILHRRSKHNFSKRVENLAADRNDAAAVRRVVSDRRFEVVFDNVYDWQRGTTAAQVEATAHAMGSHVERYVFMSSVAAYGDGLNHYEGDPLAPDNHSEPYVRNKAMTERALLRLHRKTGFPVVTFRPPFVYGPENPFYREAFFWDRLRAGRPIVIPGDGTRLMQFLHVKDLVAACLRAIEVEEAVGEAFNVGNPKPLTQVEAVREIARAAGKKPELVRVPRERIAALGGSAMNHPLYFGEYLDVPPITENVSKLQRVLGVRLTAFTTGLRETYRWYLRRPRRKIDFSLEDRLISSAGARRAV